MTHDEIMPQIERALAYLGANAQQVMETLLNKGIDLDKCCPPFSISSAIEDPDSYKDKHGASNCPVHDYLANEFPELTRIAVGTHVTRYAPDPKHSDETNFVQNPPAVRRFIEFYDQHGLDILVHD